MEQEKKKSSRPNRHRHRNKRDRVEKRKAYEKAETKQSLESSLIFKRACSEDSCLEDSRAKDFFPKDKGISIARKLSSFLRHGMKEGQFCKIDGSVEIGELARSIHIKKDWVLLATNPCFDKDKERRFLVIEKLFPNGEKQIRVAALGGHSQFIPNPPGHYQLGIVLQTDWSSSA